MSNKELSYLSYRELQEMRDTCWFRAGCLIGYPGTWKERRLMNTLAKRITAFIGQLEALYQGA